MGYCPISRFHIWVRACSDDAFTRHTRGVVSTCELNNTRTNNVKLETPLSHVGQKWRDRIKRENDPLMYTVLCTGARNLLLRFEFNLNLIEVHV